MQGTIIQLEGAKCTELAFHAPVQLAKAGNKDIDFTIEAYTGAAVDRWWGKLAIDIAGIKAGNQIPIFQQHTPTKIVGYSKKTRKDGSFFVDGVFSGVTAEAKNVRALAEEGFPWQASIGVKPLKIMSIEEGGKHTVNGYTLKGPAEVWLESEVFETSFVPLGADSNTSVTMLSVLKEAERPIIADLSAQEEGGNMPTPVQKPEAGVLTVDQLKADNPNIVDTLLAEGAEKERLRIKGIAELGIPGHKELVETLMFDGKTTPEQAALALWRAEKEVLSKASENFAGDTPPVVPHSATPEVTKPAVTPAVDDKSKPISERAKLAWDADAKLRAEFADDYDAWLAYFEADARGGVRILNGRK